MKRSVPFHLTTVGAVVVILLSVAWAEFVLSAAPAPMTAPAAPATLNVTFYVTGYGSAPRNVNVTATPCAPIGNDVWTCNLTVWNQNYTYDKEVSWLEYTPSNLTYLAGTEPTLDFPLSPHTQIVLHTYWVIMVSSGSIHLPARLHIARA